MMTSLMFWISILLFLKGHVATGKGSGRQRCKCVPDQWEGILSSVERDFDMKEGKIDMMENSIYVHYDYTNQRFVMDDLSSGKKAMADYRTGQKYIVTEFGCFKMPTNEEMRQMCLPDEAEFLGDFILGTEIPVGIWQITSSFNLTTKTTVIEKNCIPVSEEIYLAKGGYASLTSSSYLDVRLGIKDSNVFKEPTNCVQVPDATDDDNYVEIRKRKKMSSFSEMISNHLHHV